ncbi:MAG: alpha/beta fold hydrolase [Hyphomicrobiaceae bacterium]
MTAAGRDRVERLADGRAVMLRAYGAEDGAGVLMLHGTPGSRLKFSEADAAARALGLRVVAPDRWGYGGTSPHPAPSLGTFAADMGEIADRLRLDRLAVCGVSGGAPYAAAVAAEMPDRVTALALVSPVGPLDVALEDGGLVPFHRFCFRWLAQRPPVTAGIFLAYAAAIRRTPSLARRLAVLRAPAADVALMRRPEVATRLLATFAEGLRHGGGGVATDLALFGRPWRVDLARIHAPARMWCGSEDTNVPKAGWTALRADIAHLEVADMAGEGHLWVALHYGEVLEWIARAAGGTRPGA